VIWSEKHNIIIRCSSKINQGCERSGFVVSEYFTELLFKSVQEQWVDDIYLQMEHKQIENVTNKMCVKK